MSFTSDDVALWGSVYTFMSFCLFYGLNWILTSYLVPTHLKGDAVKEWRWCNYGVSFVHSTLSGSLALLCVLLTPRLLEQVVLGYSELAYITVCISFGYFWYDTFDLIQNSDKEKGNRELVVHHTFALISASLVVYTKTFVGFGLTSLLIEIHSSTLHLRVLLKLYTRSIVTTTYQILKMINMLTFFVFRFGSLFFLVYALIRDRSSTTNLGIYVFMCLAVLIIFLLSVQLFVKVLKSDSLPKKGDIIVKSKEELLDVPSVMTNGLEKSVLH